MGGWEVVRVGVEPHFFSLPTSTKAKADEDVLGHLPSEADLLCIVHAHTIHIRLRVEEEEELYCDPILVHRSRGREEQ